MDATIRPSENEKIDKCIINRGRKTKLIFVLKLNPVKR
jgi:hypothetical protein